MRRRSLLLAGLLSSTTLGRAEAAPQLTVVNVHAWDCPPCIRWHNEYKSAWLDSKEYKLVRYVEIDSPTIKQAYQERYWPEDLRPVIKHTPQRGVPRYLIIRNNKIVSDQFGVDHWTQTLANLKKLLG